MNNDDIEYEIMMIFEYGIIMIFESEYGIMINDDIEYEQRERYYLTLLVLYVGHFFKLLIY